MHDRNLKELGLFYLKIYVVIVNKKKLLMKFMKQKMKK